MAELGNFVLILEAVEFWLRVQWLLEAWFIVLGSRYHCQSGYNIQRSTMFVTRSSNIVVMIKCGIMPVFCSLGANSLNARTSVCQV